MIAPSSSDDPVLNRLLSNISSTEHINDAILSSSIYNRTKDELQRRAAEDKLIALGINTFLKNTKTGQLFPFFLCTLATSVDRTKWRVLCFQRLRQSPGRRDPFVLTVQYTYPPQVWTVHFFLSQIGAEKNIYKPFTGLSDDEDEDPYGNLAAKKRKAGVTLMTEVLNTVQEKLCPNHLPKRVENYLIL